MADNVLLNAGTGGDTAAADDIAGVKHQRVKLSLGAAGTAADAPVGAGTEAGTLRVTIATDSTGVLSVDDNGGALTVDNGGTFAVQATLAAETTKVIGTVNIAAAQTLATVTTVAAVTAISNALPAGTNAIGKLAANSGVDIGDVDVTSVIPGTGATNLGKAEDAAHASGDTGVMALAVRRDADTTLAATDGDYVPLQCNAAGSLKVAITAGAGSGGTSIADGASFTRDTTSLTPVGGVVESSAPTVTAGDAVALSLTTGGALRVAVASGGVAGIAEDSASAGAEEGIMVLAVRRDVASSGVGTDGDFAALSVTSDGSLRVSGSSGTTQYTEDGASAGAESLCLVGAVRRDTAASSSGTDGDYSTLNTDANGRLHTIAALAASQTLATVTTVSTVTNVATIGTSVTPGTAAANLGKAEDAAHTSGDTGVMSLAVRTDTAAAASGTTGDYEPFHTDSVGALWTRSTGELADDAAFTPATSRVTPVGYLADETATDSVDEGDVGAGRITLDRKQIVTSYVHAAAGGASNYTALSTAAVLTAEIKGSAGKVFSLEVFNINAAARFVRLYNQTGAPASTDTANVVWQGIIPGLTTGAGFTISWPMGKQFTTGIGIRASTGIAHNDTGALAANELTFNVSYA